MQSPEVRRGLQFVIGAIFVLLLCALSFVSFDRPAALFFLAAEPNEIGIFRAVTLIGDALYPLLLAAGIYLACRLRQRFILKGGTTQLLERWKQRALFLFFAVASSGLLVDLVKVLCGRARPTKLIEENLYGFYLFETSSRMMSFPSGHSNTAAAAALVLWYIWPKSWPLGLMIAGGVMLSRVALLKHYPSDTLAGAYLALVTTYYLYRYFCRRFPEFGGESK